MTRRNYTFLGIGLVGIAIGVMVGGFTEDVGRIWLGAIIAVVGATFVWFAEPEKL